MLEGFDIIAELGDLSSAEPEHGESDEDGQKGASKKLKLKEKKLSQKDFLADLENYDE